MKLKYKLGITYLTYGGKLFVKRKILKSLNFSPTLIILIILDSILMVLVENLSVPLPLIIYYHESSFQCGNRNHRNESLSCLSSHFQFNVEKVNSVVSCFHLFFFFTVPLQQNKWQAIFVCPLFFTRCWSHGRSCLLPKNCILTKFKITQRVGAMG